MSYIIKSSSPFVSVKLTETGREKLALGKLNFSFWAIGDSEVNYNREAIVDANPLNISLSATSAILTPVDRQPDIKTFITKNNILDPFQTIDSSNMNVVKAVVNNKAIERGFFERDGSNFTTITDNEYIVPNLTFLITNFELNGTKSLDVGGDALNVNVGDLVLLKIANTTVGNIILNENTRALPNLWFKVQEISGNVLILDRKVPNLAGDDTTLSQAIIYRAGEVHESIGEDTTTAYWDSGTLSFNSNINVSCLDVPVWNMSNVWCESVAGVTGLTSTKLYEDYTKYGSFRYLGSKNPFFEYVCNSNDEVNQTLDCDVTSDSVMDSVTKSISIIHYTNNSISNKYGEFIYTDLENDKYFSLDMPDLMYHRAEPNTGEGENMGMRFVASGQTKIIPKTNIQYIELLEDSSRLPQTYTPLVIGRLYPQLKTCVIHDDEIIMANSYKSNRNWTLPGLTAVLQPASMGGNSGVLGVNQTMYFTYVLKNTNGLQTSIGSQKYSKITNNSSSPKDIKFKLSDVNLLPYMRNGATTDGYGFYAEKFDFLYQIVTNLNDRPNPSDWIDVSYTTEVSFNNYVDPFMLEDQVGFVLNQAKADTGVEYNLIEDLDLPANTQPEELQFGDEKFFYGNVNTYIGATIFKTIFDITINSGSFNTTSNNTRSKNTTTNPPNIKISEVGIYDSEKNLVCIGKLSNPVPLVNDDTIMLEISMDF